MVLMLRANSPVMVDGASFRVRTMTHTKPPLSHGGNGDAILRLKLQVSGLFLHAHTLQEKMLHFVF